MDWMIAALGLSLLGSIHCVGMCGGFAMLAQGSGKRTNHLSFPFYLVGKTFSYVVIGAALGFLGEALHAAPAGARLLAWATGLAMILVGLHMAGIHGLSRFVTPAGSGKLVGLLSKAVSSERMSNRIILGVLNGLLPCGLLYAAFAGAASRASMLEGGLFMLLFSVGTFPSLFLAARLFGTLSGSKRLALARVSGGLVVIFGIITMLRGSAFLHALMN